MSAFISDAAVHCTAAMVLARCHGDAVGAHAAQIMSRATLSTMAVALTGVSSFLRVYSDRVQYWREASGLPQPWCVGELREGEIGQP